MVEWNSYVTSRFRNAQRRTHSLNILFVNMSYRHDPTSTAIIVCLSQNVHVHATDAARQSGFAGGGGVRTKRAVSEAHIRQGTIRCSQTIAMRSLVLQTINNVYAFRVGDATVGI